MSGSVEQANKMLENSNIKEIMAQVQENNTIFNNKPTRQDIEQKILDGRKAELQKRVILGQLIIALQQHQA